MIIFHEAYKRQLFPVTKVKLLHVIGKVNMLCVHCFVSFRVQNCDINDPGYMGLLLLDIFSYKIISIKCMIKLKYGDSDRTVNQGY